MTTRGRKWREIRKHILDRDDNRCQYCGQIATQVDHVIPVAKGGLDIEENLVAACARCNYKKHDKDVDLFMREKVKADFFAEKWTPDRIIPTPSPRGLGDFGVFTPPINERNQSA
jgi:5-methylcytosine-specific restriction endonuclease McrA